MHLGAGWTALREVRQDRRMGYPLMIWTLKSILDNGYGVSKWCTGTCSAFLPDLDVAGVVAAGYGDRSLRELPLKCPKCQGRVEMRIHPPGGRGGPVSPVSYSRRQT